MAIKIDKLKFDILKEPSNAAMAIVNKGYIPSGPAYKRGWEEANNVVQDIKVAVVGLYTSVMELARDIISLGKMDNPIIISIYKTVPEDVQITVNSILELEKKIEGKTGLFKNDDESMLAQEIVLTATDIFDKVRVLTSSMMIELQEIFMNIRHEYKSKEDLTNPNVITDVEVKV